MPFGMVSAVDRGMGVLDGDVYRRKKGAVLGVNLGRPVVIIGPLLRSCAEVREPIELSFGVVSGVNGVFSNRNVFDSFVESGYDNISIRQYIVEIYVSLVFRRYTQVQGRCWGLRAIGKNITVDTRKMDVLLHGAVATS